MDSGEYRLRPYRERSRRLACPHAGWRTAGYSPLEADSRSARRHHGCCHRTRYWNLAGRPADIDFARSCGAAHPDAPTQRARTTHRCLCKNPAVLTFAAGLFLFQLANAAMLPVVGAALVYDGESRSSIIVGALIILPQIVVALLAPWVGRQARRWGRRPLLLIGFGALPIRALLFALTADPLFLVGLQLLDGISGAIVGVLTVLVTADLTHGTGRFNLAQGIIGTASGLGAALSTALFGLIAANFDWAATFLSIASVGLLGASIMWLLMPETRPSTEK